MKLALIGVGQAGGTVADALIDYDRRTGTGFVADAIAVNSARSDLRELRHVPASRQVLVGLPHVMGHGAGADIELGADIVAEDICDVLVMVDDLPIHEIDAFLVVAGLGGGTGSGGAPVIARELSRSYAKPVYGLGLLPARDEGGIYVINAAQSLQTFVHEVDNLILFDNENWRRSGDAAYEMPNAELARRLGVLFGADGTDANADLTIETSEIISTLATGGISTVGYVSVEHDRPERGLLSRLVGRRTDSDDTPHSTNRLANLVRRAALGRLTLPCQIADIERGLVIVAGPPDVLTRRGLERGRAWVEDETGSREIRGGDYPVESNYVAAVVLFSGVYDVPRVKELQAVAIEAQREMFATPESNVEPLENLVETDADQLKPLF
ncbi:cell division protein [Haloferax mediterranei ATCC 33500]|uniref:Tubulin-like protein CetZ n=1 Tax=Haloferax mediterranei (strain ATCC 33500 / DSM 1411 / JCM 8866 / NBRC 14739 / NCIMB 2177 / R-4) TaxID=523841 RepID=I3R3M7_HALMT|nr:tubulin/FtsZ family protein [Haloferax mediterranei]AFK18837.1 cell division protein ftsZ [Haloferax mediterranei ATCC 33500]AHZ21797.1 cell division protein [Haloferax mediterranei ATCC 33500]EMA03304.1 cell division protein ftsZ [Haloferax mediterranei ATCC 33500]MDX5988931.1 tubulin/FtsZ family protein [Haloferax mediterranei ATCC 33500]QCQ75327.1 cell division protein [Haloferax mediterranei ATCC 33500]